MTSEQQVTSAHAPRTFDPLRNRVYRRVWSASLVSSVGTFLQLVAAPWLMNELTGSPFLVSAVTAALMLPRLALALPAGALADAIDRRTLLVGGYALGATAVSVMAVMATTEALGPASLLSLTLVLGVGSAIAQPAFHTLVPDLVPAPLRAQAITLTSAGYNVARAIGPSIGGALVAAGLTPVAFGLNALTSLGVIAVVAALPRQAIEDRRGRGLWRAAVLGLRYVRFTPSIRVLVALAAGFAVTSACVQALLPNVVSDELGLGATGFGLLYGAFGAGALVGATTRDRARLATGRAMLPGAMLAFGASGTVFGVSEIPGLSALALATAGMTWVWALTTLNASVQVQAPRWVRGR
ncbi:MAG TPA: MFS transporter, partial [Nitriliruptorales bacterium]